MFWYLVIALVSYLVIGVVYTVAKLIREVCKRVDLLGDENYFRWIEGANHLSEVDANYFVDFSVYAQYVRFMDKVYNTGSIALTVIVSVFTWPTMVPLLIELFGGALDKIYESRFGEEG